MDFGFARANCGDSTDTISAPKCFWEKLGPFTARTPYYLSIYLSIGFSHAMQ